MVGRIIVSIPIAVALTAAPGPAARAQDARESYDALSPAQRALLPGDVSRARDEYSRAPATFREAFELVTARLASLLLSDPENGEVLGSALDLIERVEAPAEQPAPESGTMRLAVTLAPGARDRLRRSRVLARIDGSGTLAFVYEEPPQLRLELSGQAARAIVVVIRP